MKPSVLFIVASDPRTSPRPAEAIRIAAGVGTWQKTEILLYLRDAAVLALSEFPEDLMDSDNYARYLPILSECGRPIYVQSGTPFLTGLGEPAALYQQVTDEDLASLAAKSDYVARF
jgi:hypothetical protein